MILLDSTVKSLEVVLAAAITTNQLDWTAHFVDIGQSFAISTTSEADGVTNSTTAVTLVPSPVSLHNRQVKYLSIYNKDTVAATITVRMNNNGTLRILVKVTLQAGETLEYVSE